MPGKVYVAEGEDVKSAVRRFRQQVSFAGGLLTGENLRQADRHRRKDRYLKPSEKRRQRKKVADINRRKAVLL
jgi:ribosomal protein S21